MKNTNVTSYILQIQCTKKCKINKNVKTECKHICSNINMLCNKSISTYSFGY